MSAMAQSPERSRHKRPKGRKSIAHLPVWDSDLVQETQQENLTESLASASNNGTLADKLSRKKLRSKSLGPGGLEALNSISGNAGKPVSPRPRSILKPAIPLSPLQEIPARGTTAKVDMNVRAPSDLESPEDEPSSTISKRDEQKLVQSPSSSNPTGTKMQDSSSRSSDSDQRAKEREELKRRRESRRKSLAGRRVSFAPEATLHTWDLVEEAQDSTTSTNSTRRRSSSSNTTTSIPPTLHVQESPVHASNDNTSLQAGEMNMVNESPATGTRKSKRTNWSSGIPPLNFNDPEDIESSSPFNGSFVEPERMSDTPHANSSPQGDDARPSEHIIKDTEASIEYLEDGANGDGLNDDISMDIATIDVIAPVQQSSYPTPYNQGTGIPLEAANDQENLYTHSNRRKSQHLDFIEDRSPEDNDEDLSMDLTRPLGIILGPQSRSLSSPDATASRRRISNVEPLLDDQSMEMTTAVGTIQSSIRQGKETTEVDENEDLSMEFTEAIGRIKDRPIRSQPNGDYLANLELVEETVNKEAEVSEEHEMDFTQALGTILPQISSDVRQHEKYKGKARNIASSSPSIQEPEQEHKQKSEENIVLASSPLQNHTRQRQSLSNKGSSTSPSPRRYTPGQETADFNAVQRDVDEKAKLSQNKTQKMALGRGTHSANSTPQGKGRNIFHRDPKSGGMTPTVIFAPSLQRGPQAQGLEYDRAGMGSPKVTALLDRRHSIGESAAVFSPLSFDPNNIRYEDPKQLGLEVEQQREADAQRESGRALLEQETNTDANNIGATSSLKEAIGNMSPKKNNKTRSRKSLAVGSAKGVLGKRPAELDEDNDCLSVGSPDVMHQSPVKKIKLQPHQASTAASRRRMTEVSGNARPVTPRTTSPLKNGVTTPKSQPRFRDASALPSATEELPTMGQMSSEDAVEVSTAQAAEPIELQEFLNMTSIRFMDLTTSKRRHTAVPQVERTRNISENTDEGSLSQLEPSKGMEDAVTTAACVHPWLELFQHSCRELKSYIAEGKSVVKKIEKETYAENPRIFHEYTSASPQERHVMDGQFKDMKTNARLQSQGTWYEWRRELLRGLEQILDPIETDFQNDSANLEARENLISEALPSLLTQRQLLTQERGRLQNEADELAGCDQEELSRSRAQLQSVSAALAAKHKLLNERRMQFEETVETLSSAEEAREETMGAIQEAIKVTEECRGWSASEIRQLRERVNSLQSRHGWHIIHAEDSNLLLQYRHHVEVLIDTSAFQCGNAEETKEQHRKAVNICRWQSDSKRTERVMWYLFPRLQEHLNSLNSADMSIQQALSSISSAYETCKLVSAEIAELDKHCITWVDPFGDGKVASESSQSLLVEASLLLQQLQTKVKISFTLTTAVSATSRLDLVLKRLESQVSYGQQFSKTKMESALRAQIKKTINGNGAWRDAVLELRGRLLGKSTNDHT